MASYRRLEWISPRAIYSRARDVTDLNCSSGDFLVDKIQSLRARQGFYSTDHAFIIMDWMSVIDIDDQEDRMMAKACKSFQNNV